MSFNISHIQLFLRKDPERDPVILAQSCREGPSPSLHAAHTVTGMKHCVVDPTETYAENMETANTAVFCISHVLAKECQKTCASLRTNVHSCSTPRDQFEPNLGHREQWRFVNFYGERNNGLKVLVDDELCFTSTKLYHETLSKDEQKLNIKCNQTLRGRSVTVRVSASVMSLCEVQVFVMVGLMKTATNSVSVSTHQKYVTRSGCTADKEGPGCQFCTNRGFGEDCDKQCQCLNTSEICDRETGDCKSGCTAGKNGPGCQEDCNDASFRPNYERKCFCLHGGDCDIKTGFCSNDCAAGKYGPACQKDCKDGWFGLNCTKQCLCDYVHEVCDKKTGHCVSGCTLGKQGDDCQTDCKDGWFGLNCTKQCLCGSIDEPCNKTTGHCVSGCTPGKHGNDCQTDCADYTYGDSCTGVCSCVIQSEVCNKVTGECYIGERASINTSTGHRAAVTDVTLSSAPDEEQNGIYPVVLGSLLGAACIVIIILTLVIIWLKRQVSHYKAEHEEHYVSLRDRPDSNVYDVITGPLQYDTPISHTHT